MNRVGDAVIEAIECLMSCHYQRLLIGLRSI